MWGALTSSANFICDPQARLLFSFDAELYSTGHNSGYRQSILIPLLLPVNKTTIIIIHLFYFILFYDIFFTSSLFHCFIFTILILYSRIIFMNQLLFYPSNSQNSSLRSFIFSPLISYIFRIIYFKCVFLLLTQLFILGILFVIFFLNYHH